MYKLLLFSGGKDSTFCCFLFNLLNIFININNCKNYIDKNYAYFICKNFKKIIFLLNLKKEYNKIIFNYLNKNINIDYYCNKFIKIYLIKKIYNKKFFITGHYFIKIKKLFFSSIDQKKEQIFFFNLKNNFFSLLGYYNKLYITFICKKNNFICKKKKNTSGICFSIKTKKKIFYIVFINKMILTIIFNNNFFNLGKKIFLNKIIRILNNIILINKNSIFYFYKTILLNFNNKIKNIKIKLNSQKIKTIARLFKLNNKKIIIFYKKQRFIEKNILIFYNDLAIFNSKIIKKN